MWKVQFHQKTGKQLRSGFWPGRVIHQEQVIGMVRKASKLRVISAIIQAKTGFLCRRRCNFEPNLRSSGTLWAWGAIFSRNGTELQNLDHCFGGLDSWFFDGFFLRFSDNQCDISGLHQQYPWFFSGVYYAYLNDMSKLGKLLIWTNHMDEPYGRTNIEN